MYETATNYVFNIINTKKLTFQLNLLQRCYTVSDLIGKSIVVYFQTREKQKRMYYETAMMHGMQMNKILKITFTDKLVT